MVVIHDFGEPRETEGTPADAHVAPMRLTAEVVTPIVCAGDVVGRMIEDNREGGEGWKTSRLGRNSAVRTWPFEYGERMHKGRGYGLACREECFRNAGSVAFRDFG